MRLKPRGHAWRRRYCNQLPGSFSAVLLAIESAVGRDLSRSVLSGVSRPPLLHIEAEVVPFEYAAFGKRQLRDDFVIIGQGLDFGRARRS